MLRDFSFEFCNTVSETNPYVAAPLRRTDCSLVSDGAAALVLAHPDVAADMQRAVGFRAHTHVNDILALSRRDPIAFERSEEHTSELQSLMRISYAVFCLKTKNKRPNQMQYDN